MFEILRKEFCEFKIALSQLILRWLRRFLYQIQDLNVITISLEKIFKMLFGNQIKRVFGSIQNNLGFGWNLAFFMTPKQRNGSSIEYMWQNIFNWIITRVFLHNKEFSFDLIGDISSIIQSSFQKSCPNLKSASSRYNPHLNILDLQLEINWFDVSINHWENELSWYLFVLQKWLHHVGVPNKSIVYLYFILGENVLDRIGQVQLIAKIQWVLIHCIKIIKILYFGTFDGAEIVQTTFWIS